MPKNFTKWNEEKIGWLKINYNKSYKELCKYLEIGDETIRLKIKELGLERTTKYRPFKLNMEDQEFLSDLDNPRLTAPDIVSKYKNSYGISESRIWQLRKKRGIKLQVNTLSRESIAESRVRKVLDELDLAYIKEKHIGKYHIDFYLGQHLCIEVQGNYWHSKPKRILTDKRKKDFLENLGYKILYINESDIPKSREKILEFTKLGSPYTVMYRKKLCEPLLSGCIVNE